MQKDISDLEANIQIKFKNIELLKMAMTHRSYLNEHPSLDIEHNERLEFLGDAVLELSVTDHLYRTFPNPEGELTNFRAALVNHRILGRIAEDLNFNDHVRLSRGEAKDTGRARLSILANAMEAVIGAIYLDQGFAAADEFIKREILSELPSIMEEGAHIDPKSHLQEVVQAKQGVTPNYEVISETGPDHAKVFEVGVYVNGDEIGKGEGHSKQEAEISAAENALSKIK